MAVNRTFTRWAVVLVILLADIVHSQWQIECLQPNAPSQMRISIGNSNLVFVSWMTGGYFNYTAGVEVYDDTPHPKVQYSTNPNLTNSTPSSHGISTSYGSSLTKTWFHSCEIIVEPSTTYFFQSLPGVVCTNKSRTYSFTSPPMVGSTKPFNITIVGDLGNNNAKNNQSATKTIAALTEVVNTTGVFLHVGDISYADDEHAPLFANYEKAWNLFQTNMEPVTGRSFYMTAPGNHEATCSQLGDFMCDNSLNRYFRNFSAYLNRFNMPGNISGGYKNMWYSFDYGLVHFVIINTETDFPGAPSGPGTCLNAGNFQVNGTQLKWLDSDLSKANKNRTRTPWIVVAGHRPFYGSAPNYTLATQFKPACNFTIASDNCEPCRDAFRDTLFKYNVDFYFCGHVHWYERLFPVNRDGLPVANNYTNPQGLIHITSGAGGAAEGANYFNETGKARASATISSTYGYTQLEIKNGSHCQLRFFDSIKRNVTDTVDIIRQH